MIARPRCILVAAALAAVLACDRPELLPDIAVSTDEIAFEAPGGSGDPAPQELFVANSGNGSLARPEIIVSYLGGAGGWLTPEISAGDAPYRVTLHAQVGTRAPGTYTATLTIASGNASSSPIQVPVTLRVPDPQFALSTTELAFAAPRGGGDPGPEFVQVTNGGRGTLPVPQVAISYVATEGWLTVEVSGTPASYLVAAHATAAGLPSGTYTATMTLAAQGTTGPARTLSVTLSVPEPEVAVSRAAIQIDGPEWGADPDVVTFEVTNAGGGLLAPPTALVEYQDPADAAWLTAAVSGSAPPYVVTLAARQSVQGERLVTGFHTASVLMRSPNAVVAPEPVIVRLRVPPPMMWASPSTPWVTTFDACPLPDPLEVLVLNGGAGRLARPTATVQGDGAAWLEATVGGEREPWTVTLRMIALPPLDPYGVATARVLLESPGTFAAPIDFTFLLNPPWALPVSTASPPAVQVRAQLGAGDPAPQRVRVTTSGACPSVTPRVELAAGDPDWVVADVASRGPVADVVVHASASGLAHGEGRSATVVMDGALDSLQTELRVPVTITAAALVPAGPMRSVRSGHSLTALGYDGALAAGGYVNGGFVATSEIYDASSGTWLDAGYMPHGRTGHGAARLPDGRVLVAGGRTTWGPDFSATVDVWGGGYPPWQTAGELTRGRNRPSLVPLPNGKVLVTSFDGAAELYDPSTGTSAAVDTPLDTNGAAIALGDGRALVVGYGTASLYDDATKTWSATGPPARNRRSPALVRLPDGRVLAVGRGYDETLSAELWDPATGAWTLTGTPLSGHDDTDTVLLENGKVASIAGGLQPYGTFSADVELWDPATGEWSVVGALPSARGGTLAVRLASGMLLFAGGDIPSNYPSATAEAFTW